MDVLPPDVILPARIFSEAGAIERLLPECRTLGGRGVLVHGRSLVRSGALDRIRQQAPEGLTVESWEYPGGEPTLRSVSDLRACCRETGAEWVAAVGGGSVLDLAKAAAGLCHGGAEILDYHEDRPLERAGLPFAAAPTTAGTGSEVTLVSVLINRETGVKKSIRHPSFMPRLVVLDPDLLRSCPPAVIAHSGMDAFTQAVESYASNQSSWFTDSLALEGLSLVARSLLPMARDPGHGPAHDLLIGSAITGIAFSSSRLGIVHGIAHPLGVRYDEPHGLVCAVCLPPALELNRESMGDRYDAMSGAVGTDLITFTSTLIDALGIMNPFQGQALADVDRIIEEAMASGSTRANPKPITPDDIRWLLRRLFSPETGLPRRSPKGETRNLKPES